MNSNAERISPRYALAEENALRMLGYSFNPRNARFLARGLGGQSIETPVMTPNVPSDPINSCLRS